ncbi:MAG TPA: hypothetical protein VFR47_10105 [Anaerolineales bacterium]|nr:hypothetical protein [Anaerolineales bacterium]
MTAQITDQFVLRDQRYTIAGVKGNELFVPENFGLEPFSLGSGCWRGYVCEYGLKDEHLVLERLGISLGYYAEPEAELKARRKFQDIEGPPINGVIPFKPTKPIDKIAGKKLIIHGILDQDCEYFNNAYKGLGLRINFTGGILIGDGFIERLFVGMGFQPAWKYKMVMELSFVDGMMTEQRNVSHQIGELRQKMIKQRLEPDLKASKDELRTWIESAFSLDYDL